MVKVRSRAHGLLTEWRCVFPGQNVIPIMPPPGVATGSDGMASAKPEAGTGVNLPDGAGWCRRSAAQTTAMAG
jgi:hypothetical protein